jgi:hypothetical protein
MREQHAAAIGGIGVKPHSFAIRDGTKLAQRIDRAGIRASEDGHDAHGMYSAFTVVCDGGFECVQADAKYGIGGQRAQRVSP